MGSISYTIEVSYAHPDNAPFFTTKSPHPFHVAVGDELTGDLVSYLERNEDIKLASGERLVVAEVRHYLFASEDGSLPARNLRVAVVKQG